MTTYKHTITVITPVGMTKVIIKYFDYKLTIEEMQSIIKDDQVIHLSVSRESAKKRQLNLFTITLF
jgi:hypothetical protein